MTQFLLLVLMGLLTQPSHAETHRGTITNLSNIPSQTLSVYVEGICSNSVDSPETGEISTIPVAQVPVQGAEGKDGSFEFELSAINCPSGFYLADTEIGLIIKGETEGEEAPRRAGSVDYFLENGSVLTLLELGTVKSHIVPPNNLSLKDWVTLPDNKGRVILHSWAVLTKNYSKLNNRDIAGYAYQGMQVYPTTPADMIIKPYPYLVIPATLSDKHSVHFYDEFMTVFGVPKIQKLARKDFFLRKAGDTLPAEVTLSW